MFANDLFIYQEHSEWAILKSLFWDVLLFPETDFSFGFQSLWNWRTNLFFFHTLSLKLPVNVIRITKIFQMMNFMFSIV